MKPNEILGFLAIVAILVFAFWRGYTVGAERGVMVKHREVSAHREALGLDPLPANLCPFCYVSNGAECRLEPAQ